MIRPLRLIAVSAWLGVVLATRAWPVAAADQAVIEAGRQEFQRSCAACHGKDARGQGPMADLLRTPPPDLTALARRNGGRFPLRRVLEIIDGRRLPRAHGPREMPIWGDRFHEEAAEVYGPQGAGPIVRLRLLQLVFYLQSIQAAAR